MSLSVSHFLDDLYNEHVEEAAFLYDFVQASTSETDFQWTEAHEFEDRREAHIDALTLGGRAALTRCHDLADDGAGELYVYASVILRQGRTDEFGSRMAEIEICRFDSLEALTLALTEHADDRQLNQLGTRNLDTCCSMTLLAVCRAMERRRLSVSLQALRQVLSVRLDALLLNHELDVETADEDPGENCVARFGTVADSAFVKAQLAGMQSNDEGLRDECIFNLQHCAETLHRHWHKQALKPGARGHAAIMTGADAAFAQSLFPEMKTGGHLDIIRALAISGLPEAVRALVLALDSDLAESAATALFCITGAELLESVFEEEVIDEDELFEEERQAFTAGNKPLRADGSPFGEERTRISIDPDRWKQWLTTNKARFVAGIRYRLGEPITPDSLVRVLRREDTPKWIRAFTVQELRCRYGMTVPFHVSMTVRQQLPCLRAMRKSAAAVPDVVPGKWYLGGRLIAVRG